MEPVDDLFESSSSRDEKVEALDLLEESWFENLLYRKTRMLKCHSDLCPSSNFGQEILVKNLNGENTSLTRKLTEDNDLASPNLVRTPSLPPCLGREDGTKEKQSDRTMSKLNQQTVDLKEMCLTHSSSLPRCRPPRNLEVETIKSNCTKEMRRRYLNQTKSKKSPSDLEIDEVQGFKDLGFTFDKDLSPSVVHILPGLQQKQHEDLDQDTVRRPYLSEAWCVQSCAPLPIPNWSPRASTEDMEAQIKFWARSVASNMRQVLRTSVEINGPKHDY